MYSSVFMEIQVNQITLFYKKIGRGRPLLMIHGNGEDHGIFLEAAERLKEQFTCYLIDSRGHGQSSDVESLSYQDMADDVIAFIQAMNLEKVDFYGFSDGGITGLLAAGQSDLIDHLIISGANLYPLGLKFHIYVGMLLEYLQKRDDKLRLMLREPHISDGELKKIKARTLVLAGSKDVIRKHHTEHIAKKIENSTLKILEGETHGSYIVNSSKIADLIRDFIYKA